MQGRRGHWPVNYTCTQRFPITIHYSLAKNIETFIKSYLFSSNCLFLIQFNLNEGETLFIGNVKYVVCCLISQHLCVFWIINHIG